MTTTRNVPLAVIDVDAKARAYVNDALDRHRLAPGTYVAAFEEQFARAHGCRAAIACNSGASALQVAVAAAKEARGWRDGDEVLVPALTFVTAPNAVLGNGLRPRFVDVDPHTYGLAVERVEAAVGPRTRAILAAHPFGLPCDVEPLDAIARQHGLAVLEDSCGAMLTTYRGRSVGSIGLLGCFSTAGSQPVATGTGGLVTTSDDDLALLCRSLIAHGRDPRAHSSGDDPFGLAPHQHGVAGRPVVRLGLSCRLGELEAAVGLAQLERCHEIVAQRRHHARRLLEQLVVFEDRLQLPVVPPDRDHAFTVLPIVVRRPGERDALVHHLARHGIDSRVMFPLLAAPAYRRLIAEPATEWPAARWLQTQGFYIGCHQGLSEDDIAYVGEVFRSYYAEHQLAAAAENAARVRAVAHGWRSRREQPAGEAS
jgi:dTDP-4-amino-4,6-dideoxygalactose transaminase